jgi:hypothetical protein
MTPTEGRRSRWPIGTLYELSDGLTVAVREPQP